MCTVTGAGRGFFKKKSTASYIGQGRLPIVDGAAGRRRRYAFRGEGMRDFKNALASENPGTQSAAVKLALRIPPANRRLPAGNPAAISQATPSDERRSVCPTFS
jgi:hypothetical protein